MLHTLHLSLTNDAKHVSLTEILNLQYRGVKTSEALITQCMLFVIIDLIAIRMWHLLEKTRNIEATALFLLKPLISLQQHCFYILLLHKLKSALSSTLICPFCRVGSFFSCCTTHQITWPEGDALQLIKSYINIKADCFFFLLHVHKSVLLPNIPHIDCFEVSDVICSPASTPAIRCSAYKNNTKWPTVDLDPSQKGYILWDTIIKCVPRSPICRLPQQQQQQQQNKQKNTHSLTIIK